MKKNKSIKLVIYTTIFIIALFIIKNLTFREKNNNIQLEIKKNYKNMIIESIEKWKNKNNTKTEGIITSKDLKLKFLKKHHNKNEITDIEAKYINEEFKITLFTVDKVDYIYLKDEDIYIKIDENQNNTNNLSTITLFTKSLKLNNLEIIENEDGYHWIFKNDKIKELYQHLLNENEMISNMYYDLFISSILIGDKILNSEDNKSKKKNELIDTILESMNIQFFIKPKENNLELSFIIMVNNEEYAISEKIELSGESIEISVPENKVVDIDNYMYIR